MHKNKIFVAIFKIFLNFDHTCFVFIFQLFMNYGSSFIKEPRYQREEFLLKNFQFECTCEACKYEWPLFEDMSNNLEFLTKA